MDGTKLLNDLLPLLALASMLLVLVPLLVLGREIAVLFGMGVVLIVLASWQFRRVLTR